MSSSTSQRRRFVGANWKCNGTVKSVQALVEILNGSPVPASVDVVVGVPALHAGLVKSTLHSDYQIALQNCYVKSGAFTGEHSVDMIADFGISWVIIGHSERRHIFRETDEEIADKVTAALKANLKVIFCIGELLEERQALQTLKVCERQLKAVAAQVSDWSNIVIAYEPVWAIGTGHTATPAQAQEVHADLRNWLATNVSAEVASTIRIIYGGSVNGANSAELFTQPDIDGFLVGGASLKPEFLTIISNASK